MENFNERLLIKLIFNEQIKELKISLTYINSTNKIWIIKKLNFYFKKINLIQMIISLILLLNKTLNNNFC